MGCIYIYIYIYIYIQYYSPVDLRELVEIGGDEGLKVTGKRVSHCLR